MNMITNQLKSTILTKSSVRQWNRMALTLVPLPGVQGVRPLVSGDSTLHSNGPQNDQQQTGNFGVHNYLRSNRKRNENLEKPNVQRSYSSF